MPLLLFGVIIAVIVIGVIYIRLYTFYPQDKYVTMEILMIMIVGD